ncbi:MAG: restriction endonuclease [Candidatus Cryptobacteroides sp.]
MVRFAQKYIRIYSEMNYKIALIFCGLIIISGIFYPPGVLIISLLCIMAIVIIVIITNSKALNGKYLKIQNENHRISSSNVRYENMLATLKRVCDKLGDENLKLRVCNNEILQENIELRAKNTELENQQKNNVILIDELTKKTESNDCKLPILKNYQYNNGYEYEVYCAFKLADQGFRNIEITQKTNDFGADIICESNGIKICVQCKCYSYGSIGIDAVQEVVAALAHYGCQKGVIMTTGTLTPSAIQLAYENNVEIIDNFY